jgi:hypothetical protein
LPTEIEVPIARRGVVNIHGFVQVQEEYVPAML